MARDMKVQSEWYGDEMVLINVWTGVLMSRLQSARKHSTYSGQSMDCFSEILCCNSDISKERMQRECYSTSHTFFGRTYFKLYFDATSGKKSFKRMWWLDNFHSSLPLPTFSVCPIWSKENGVWEICDWFSAWILTFLN